MLDNHMYTDKEMYTLTSKIPRIEYIGIDDEFKEELFHQIKWNNKYIPYIISSYGRIFSINYRDKKHHIHQLKT